MAIHSTTLALFFVEKGHIMVVPLKKASPILSKGPSEYWRRRFSAIRELEERGEAGGGRKMDFARSRRWATVAS